MTFSRKTDTRESQRDTQTRSAEARRLVAPLPSQLQASLQAGQLGVFICPWSCVCLFSVAKQCLTLSLDGRGYAILKFLNLFPYACSLWMNLMLLSSATAELHSCMNTHICEYSQCGFQ